ncbi:MAG TPA: hypothetical protein VFP45_02980, partial [Candidatus Nitrosotalea sp.]|nr:hypothetical protein [Candidatus Nitrosotalea sp.]
MAALKKSYSLFGIFAIFVLLLVPPTNNISMNPLSSPDTASAATGTGSIVLNGVQTTSGTVSSAPYQTTISNFNAGTGTNRLLVVGAYSFSGVDQTTPIPTSITNHNSATSASSPTISITTKNSNSWVLDLPSIYGGQTLGSPTCTQQWDINIANAITGASSSTSQASAGSVTCSWTASGGGDSWDDAAIEVKPSGTSTATVPG